MNSLIALLTILNRIIMYKEYQIKEYTPVYMEAISNNNIYNNYLLLEKILHILVLL